jgi:small-conductance mechanosensitive channel
MITKIFSKGPVKIKNHIMLFIVRAIGTILCIIGLISLLGIWGIDVSSIIAGLGLTGFALGFALKDVLASSIAGFLLLFHQPFKIKSKVAVMGVVGIVVDIDMRYTTIEDSTGKHLIPNSKILSEKVTLLKDN